MELLENSGLLSPNTFIHLSFEEELPFSLKSATSVFLDVPAMGMLSKAVFPEKLINPNRVSFRLSIFVISPRPNFKTSDE